VDLRRLRSVAAMFGVGVISFLTPHGAPGANAAQGWRFHLEEATIADVQRAIRAKQITAAQLVNLYFKRIEAYKDLGR
jgi:amidase